MSIVLRSVSQRLMVTEFSWQLAAAGLLEFSTAPMFTAAELVRTRAELVEAAAFLIFTDVELMENVFSYWVTAADLV